MSPSIHPLQVIPGMLASVVGYLVGIARGVAFYSAVVFPVIYASGYLAISLDPALTLPSMRVLGAIIGANLVAVFLGHGYEGARPRSVSESRGAREPGPAGD